MKFTQSIVIAALLGLAVAGDAVVPAEVAGDAGSESKEEVAAEIKEKIEEKKLPTAEGVAAEAAAVLKGTPAPAGSALESQLAAARKVDAAEAEEVAKYDAVGKSIISGMYEKRAQDVLDAAAKAKAAQKAMVEVLEARAAANEAAEKQRQADAFIAHKAHVLHVKEHYATLEAGAAKEVASSHAAWKARYDGQKRLPADTAGETWTANMPDHVIEEPDFYIRAPAPLSKVIAKAKEDEAKAEGEAAPAFLQLSRRTQKLSQKRAAESSESSESSGSSSDSSSSDSD